MVRGGCCWDFVRRMYRGTPEEGGIAPGVDAVGDVFDIRWEKDSPWGITHYYDGNEQEIRLNPGTTWVEIVQNDRIDSVTYQ